MALKSERSKFVMQGPIVIKLTASKVTFEINLFLIEDSFKCSNLRSAEEFELSGRPTTNKKERAGARKVSLAESNDISNKMKRVKNIQLGRQSSYG